VPLNVLLTLFPEGKYSFSGKTVGGDNIGRTATLTHAIPAGPQVSAVLGKGNEVSCSCSGMSVAFDEAVEGRVEMTLKRNGSAAELRIANTGAGIPATLLPRVFDRFFRGDPSHNSTVEGCGLGLSIAQWIVKAPGWQDPNHLRTRQIDHGDCKPAAWSFRQQDLTLSGSRKSITSLYPRVPPKKFRKKMPWPPALITPLPCREVSFKEKELPMRALIVTMFCLTAGAIFAAEPTGADSPIEITPQASVNFGFADGFLQTPAGGEPGTSTARRPTFNELNIEDVVFYDTRLKLRWHQLAFYGGYQIIRFDGSATLSEPLVSRGITFLAGDSVRTNDQVDWYDAGVSWRFDLLNRRLALAPKAEIAVLDFSYELSSPSQSVNRGYAKPAVRLGIESVYQLASRLSFRLDGAASIPISNIPQSRQ
jgi:hypothetical protein